MLPGGAAAQAARGIRVHLVAPRTSERSNSSASRCTSELVSRRRSTERSRRSESSRSSADSSGFLVSASGLGPGATIGVSPSLGSPPSEGTPANRTGGPYHTLHVAFVPRALTNHRLLALALHRRLRPARGVKKTGLRLLKRQGPTTTCNTNERSDSKHALLVQWASPLTLQEGIDRTRPATDQDSPSSSNLHKRRDQFSVLTLLSG